MTSTKKPTTSAIRLFRQKLIAASALTIPLLTFASGLFVASSASAADTTLPTGGTALTPGVTIGSPVGGTLTINQTGQRGLINWNSFNIGTDATVRFRQQQGASAITVNRVVGGGSDPTRILGRLTADGKVMVLDRNGVLFGPNAQVNVGGIVAAAADLGNEAAFIAGTDGGRITLANAGTGTIENQGVIKADALVALIGKDVKNSSEIKAAKIALAAGMTDATVDVDGSGLVEFAVTPQAVQALVENTGTLKADGGVVSLTTAGVDVVAKSVINMSGVTTAKTVKVDGGRITLGGKVTARGGNIKVKARSEGFADEIKVTSAAEIVATNGGNISLDANGAAGGFVTIEGTVEARDGNVALNGRQNRLLGNSTVSGDKVHFTGGLVNQTAGSTLIANRLTGEVQDTAAFRGTNNQIRRVGDFATGLRATSAGGFTLVNASGRRLGLTGEISTDGGAVSITHNDRLRLRSNSAVLSEGGTIALNTAGDLSLADGSSLDAAGGTVDLNVTGGLSQDLTSRITAALLKVQTTADAVLTGGNDVDTVTSFTSGGAIAFHDVDGYALAGDLTTQGGDINLTTDSTNFAQAITVNTAARILSNNGNISIDTNGHTGGFITVNGLVDAGTGDVALNGRQNRLLGTSTVSGDAVDFQGGLVNQAATSRVIANTLTGAVQDTALFLGTGNQIGSIGDFTTGLRGSSVGGFTLVNASGRRLDINGQILADGGDIAVTHNNRLDVRTTGAVVSGGGDVDLTATGNNFLYANGLLDARGTAGSGDVTLSSGSDIQMTAATSRIHAGLLTLNSGNNVSQSATGSINAEQLAGTVDKTITLSGTTNTIRQLGNITTGAHPIASILGGFSLTNNTDTTVVGNVLGGGGNITLNNTGNVDLAAGSSLDAEGGTVDLNVTGGLTQDLTSRIAAALLKVQTTADAVLTGANDVDTVTSFTSGGAIAFHDVDGYALAGDLTTQGGDINLTTDSTNFAQAITVNTAARILSNNGNISIDTNGHTGGFITVNGLVDAGTGDVALNGRQNRLLGTSTVSGDAVDFQGGLVNQAATSRVIANTLTGAVQATALFLGTGNQIGSIGDFTTGLRGSSVGGFTLVNASGRRLDINGQILADGGDIAVTHNNRLDVRTTGAVVSGGGDVDLTATGNNFLYANGLVDARGTAGNGDVTLSSGSDIQMTAATSRIHAGLLTLNSGNNVSQSATGSINADQLAGTVDKTITLNGTTNTIRQLGNITTGAHPIASILGGFSLQNTTDTTVVGNVLGGGGNITLNNTGNVDLASGSSLDAEGGNINVNQSGILSSAADTLKTTGTGVINITQRQGGSIDQAVNAFANSGTGLNTLTVEAGTYAGNIAISDSNVALNGAQRGVDARDGRAGAIESIVQGYILTANNVDGLTIDGFTIQNQGQTVAAYGGKGSINLNSDNTNIALLNNIFAGQDAGGADYRSGIVTSSGGGADVLIANNRFSDLRYGVYANPAADGLVIEDNVFTGNNYGVVADGVASLDLNRNVIDATLAGVVLSGSSTNVTLTDNQISGAAIGLSTRGGDVGLVNLNSNTFTNNATGARFESGLVDLGGAGNFNTFTGGDIGIQLNPTGLVERMQLANDSLGYTRFAGQTAYYVRLDNGAYFIGGRPLQIDALNVSFDGVVPAASTFGDGILTLAQFRAIEGKLWDLDDAAGRGQIFAGFVPGLNQEDLFPNGLGIFGSPSNGFSLTITAGQGVVIGRATSAQSLAASLNALAPAAGGEDDADADSLANIEPAAGGEDDTTTTRCWSDFVSNAGVTTVEYNSTGSMADAMSAEEGCSI